MKGGVDMAITLFTGATGVVGSSLLPLLLERGDSVICLARGNSAKTATDRIFDIVGRGIENVTVWNGDVTLPNAGVRHSDIEEWRGRIDKVIHCAASVKFDDAFADLNRSVNVEGTQNTLNLANMLEIPEFHQLSTAYIAGDSDSFGENDFDIGQTCRNIYEVTKKEAESLVRTRWHSGRYSFYRLSIVVGDSVSGYIPAFDGYYGFLSGLEQMRQSFAGHSATEASKYAESGIFFDDDGMLVLPISFNFAPKSTLNLVPRDWVANMLSELTALPADGQTFHVVHSNPPPSRWVNDVSLYNLGIKGYSYGVSGDRSNSLLGRLQKMFDRGLKRYTPYITHEADFCPMNAERMLGDRYIPVPEIDYLLIKRILNYAQSVNFGKKEREMVGAEA